MTRAGSQVIRRSASVEETVALGERLGRSLIGGMTIGLVGALGAGKTQLVKGIATGNGLGESRRVTSPTFTLIHEYTGRLTLYHIDAFRLATARDLTALGYDELVREDSVVVVEWADRVRSAIAEDALWIELAVTGETSRILTARAGGSRFQAVLETLRAPDG